MEDLDDIEHNIALSTTPPCVIEKFDLTDWAMIDQVEESNALGKNICGNAEGDHAGDSVVAVQGAKFATSSVGESDPAQVHNAECSGQTISAVSDEATCGNTNSPGTEFIPPWLRDDEPTGEHVTIKTDPMVAAETSCHSIVAVDEASSKDGFYSCCLPWLQEETSTEVVLLEFNS